MPALMRLRRVHPEMWDWVPLFASITERCEALQRAAGYVLHVRVEVLRRMEAEFQRQVVVLKKLGQVAIDVDVECPVGRVGLERRFAVLLREVDALMDAVRGLGGLSPEESIVSYRTPSLLLRSSVFVEGPVAKLQALKGYWQVEEYERQGGVLSAGW